MKQLFTIGVIIGLIGLPAQGPAMTFEEGLAIVTEKGREVQIAGADADSAREAVSLARSPWLPWIDIYGRETWLQYQPEAKTPFGPMPTSQDRFLSYGIKATQLLYDFGRTSSSVSAAQHGLRSREIGAIRARNRAALDFALSYLDLLESEKLLQVASNEVKRFEAHRKDADVRFGAGVVTKNEVLQADVLLADSRQRFITADNMRSLRASKINSLVMLPLNDPVTTAEITASPAVGIPLQEAWSIAESESPDIRDMDARIGAKAEGVNAVRAEYLPTLYVSGGYDYLENKYQVHQDNWSLIAGVNINLFAGGASNAKVGAAKSELRGLKLARDKMIDSLRLEVKAAYLDIRSAEQKIEVAKASVAQAEENLRLQKLRYQEGVGTATEVLDAVSLLSAAESGSWKAMYSLKRAEALLLFAMGRDLTAAYKK